MSPKTSSREKGKKSIGQLVGTIIGVVALIVVLAFLGEGYLRYIDSHGVNDREEYNRYYETMKVSRYVVRNRKNTKGVFGGVDIGINVMGLRGPKSNTRKKPGVYRVLLLGDEKTFGWGVEEKDTYAYLLQQKLENTYIGKFEVLNGGVPGYNLPDIAEYMRHNVLQFAPDVICLLIGSDDVLGNLEPKKREELFQHGLLHGSYLMRLLYRLFIYRPTVEPDTAIAAKANRTIRDIEEMAIRADVPLLLFIWSPPDDALRPQAISAIPQSSMMIHATIIDTAPALAKHRSSQMQLNLFGDYLSLKAHKLLAEFHLAALTLRAPNFIFQRRDGKPVQRDIDLDSPTR